MRYIRRVESNDFEKLKDIYLDAIKSISTSDYSKKQIEAWGAKAYLPNLLDNCFSGSKGWLSVEGKKTVAFAIRKPENRISLLYTRGEYKRQGHATSLLKKTESDAVNDGQKYLVTEASFLSKNLFIKFGWKVQTIETIKIAGVPFERFLMRKNIIT